MSGEETRNGSQIREPPDVDLLSTKPKPNAQTRRGRW